MTVAAMASAPTRRPCMRSSRGLGGSLHYSRGIASQPQLSAARAPKGTLRDVFRLLGRSSGDDAGLVVRLVARLGRLRYGRPNLRFLDPRLAQRRCELAPVAARLDVGRVVARHRPIEPILGAVGI